MKSQMHADMETTETLNYYNIVFYRIYNRTFFCWSVPCRVRYDNAFSRDVIQTTRKACNLVYLL